MDAFYFPTKFTVTVFYVDFEAAFHGAAFHEAEVAAERVEAFKADPENAAIFVRKDTGDGISARRLFRWYLARTDSGPVDHVPPETLREAYQRGEAVCQHPVRLNFGEGMFGLETDRGLADLRALTLYLRLVVRPQPK